LNARLRQMRFVLHDHEIGAGTDGELVDLSLQK
jgi:hypothetical protein